MTIFLCRHSEDIRFKFQIQQLFAVRAEAARQHLQRVAFLMIDRLGGNIRLSL